MLCVTVVYLRDITRFFFFDFALECESSELLLFLFVCLFVFLSFEYVGFDLYRISFDYGYWPARMCFAFKNTSRFIHSSIRFQSWECSM